MRICLVLLVVLTGFCSAEEAEPTTEQVRAWVENLSSGNYAKRASATKQLVSAGRATIAPLMEAMAEQGLEVTTRGVYVLQQLAVCGEEETEEAARQSLVRVAAPRVTAAARHARDALVKLDSLRQRRAIEELERLGALVEHDYIEVLLRIGSVFRVEINEEWRGGTEGLRWLRYLRDVEQVTFVGPQVTDEWLTHLEAMRNVFTVKIKRANITSDGLATLSRVEQLKVLILFYMPLADDIIKPIAECQRLEQIHIYGSKMTRDGAEQLRKASAAVVKVKKGAFLGIVASEPDNLDWQIDRVTAGGAADRAGLQAGDSLVTYDGKPVGNFDTLRSLLAENEAGDTVIVAVRRDGQIIEREVTLGEWE